MKKERTDSLEYIAKKHKQEQEEYLKAGVVKRVALYARQSVDKKDSISIDTQLDACRRLNQYNTNSNLKGVITMKKMITIVLCLLLTLSLVGCGKNDDEGVVVGGDTCPAVCIDGVTYYDTGKAVPGEPDESVIEYVEIPLGGGAVGTVEAFARLEEGKMIVCLINHEWYEFVAK